LAESSIPTNFFPSEAKRTRFLENTRLDDTGHILIKLSATVTLAIIMPIN